MVTFDVVAIPFEGVARSELDNLVHDFALPGGHAQLGAEFQLPAAACNPRRQKYPAGTFRQQAQAACRDGPVLAVTGFDLHADGLNFVFGLADSRRWAAVIPLHRPRFRAGDARFRARAVKDAVHELGLTLGPSLCPNPECVKPQSRRPGRAALASLASAKHISNSPAGTDRKGQVPCPRCRARGLLSA